MSDRASVRQGNVTWDLTGASYSLTNSLLATPSLAVAEFQGTATLNLSGGALNSVNSTIAPSSGGNGAVNALAGTNWTNTAALAIGAGGVGSLTIASQASVYVGTNVAVGPSGTLNVNGGTLRFDTFSPNAGSTVNYTAGTIQVSGNRTIDSDSAVASFFGVSPTIGSGKQLAVEGTATVSTVAPVTLAGGTLTANNGLAVTAGGHINGNGVIDTPNATPQSLTNNGTITGDSAVSRITTTGYISGTGSLDNVTVAGTYSPGPGAASVTLGSVNYNGALDIEIGGTTPGSTFDQLNHTLGSGVVNLGGALDLSFIDGFAPAANDVFEILTATGGVTGAFAMTMLPTLPGDLFWSVIYGANSVDLMVEAPVVMLPGDFDGNGIVDMADYVMWRDGLGTTYTQNDYDIWRAHFGETIATGPSLADKSVTIPEPASLTLASWCILTLGLIRHRNSG